MTNDTKGVKILATSGAVLVVGLVAAFAFGGPYYSVWQQRLAGEASLARATQDRQIAVLDAKAKSDAAVELANAEIARARGVAQANKIIGDSLKDNEEYLRYLWIDGLQNTKDQIIYVPTEGNLPILESGRGVTKP